MRAAFGVKRLLYVAKLLLGTAKCRYSSMAGSCSMTRAPRVILSIGFQPRRFCKTGGQAYIMLCI